MQWKASGQGLLPAKPVWCQPNRGYVFFFVNGDFSHLRAFPLDSQEAPGQIWYAGGRAEPWPTIVPERKFNRVITEKQRFGVNVLLAIASLGR